MTDFTLTKQQEDRIADAVQRELVDVILKRASCLADVIDGIDDLIFRHLDNIGCPKRQSGKFLTDIQLCPFRDFRTTNLRIVR